ncbi:MAG: hypothetical protein IPK26_18085 [Planctomycetes bacterium]|nr:hypothetical protein [Planctomycetota bacterium]
MNIGNVQGNGGIERGADRPTRTEQKRSGAALRSEPIDQAAISTGGREKAASVEALTERARDPGEDRREKIQRAMSRLMSGELDSVAAHKAAAQKVLQSDFLDA